MRYTGRVPNPFVVGPTRLVVLALLCSCGPGKTSEDVPEEADTISPGFWEYEDTVPLNSARVLLAPTIVDAVGATELQVFQDMALSVVLDSLGRRVHVLDSRYGIDGRAYCIDQTSVSLSSAKGDAAICPEGTTEVQRGALSPPTTPVAFGLDPVDHTVVLLTRGGVLYQASADIVNTDPMAFLRLDGGTLVPELRPPVEAGRVAVHDGRVAIAAQGRLLLIDETGTTDDQLPGDVIHLVLDESGPRALTESGVWTESDILAVTGDGLVRWQDAFWVVQTDEEQVLRLPDLEPVAVGTITGPAATDPRTDVLHLATPTGFVRVSPDGTLEPVEIAVPILDLDINLAGETVLLHDEGLLTVLVDETAYNTVTPLDIFITTFSERPRNPDDAVRCEGKAPSIAAFMERSLKNRTMLDDLPAPVGMGITPTLVSHADACGVRDQLVQLMDHPLTSSGILVHEEPSDCTGQLACHTAFLKGMLAEFSNDLTPSWMSGMSAHNELGVNWVASVEDAGMPSRYLFYGMSLLPEVLHHADLRAKDSWPITLGDQSRAWSADSAAAIAERGGTGSLGVYTGGTIAAFNLGACHSLFLVECHALGRGGGVKLDADDVAVLDLLLHRSLTQESPATVRSWSFHLPNIGEYDYTLGCTQSGRRWSGEDCAAARLQEWFIDVDRRLVQAGLVRWTRPGDLAHP